MSSLAQRGRRGESRWPERPARDHVAFGAGIPMCVGQMLARLESEMRLSALLTRFERIGLAGPPVCKLNNTLRPFAHLPIELTPAIR